MASYGIKNKNELIEKHRINSNDTGSAQLQICLLTERINCLVEHLKNNKRDSNTRNGLLALVGRRRKLIKYLTKRNPEDLNKIAAELKIKVKKQ